MYVLYFSAKTEAWTLYTGLELPTFCWRQIDIGSIKIGYSGVCGTICIYDNNIYENLRMYKIQHTPNAFDSRVLNATNTFLTPHRGPSLVWAKQTRWYFPWCGITSWSVGALILILIVTWWCVVTLCIIGYSCVTCDNRYKRKTNIKHPIVTHNLPA